MSNLEDLTKTQVVLLTILVAFITSIATGIITASLLAAAPASVVQTINRVVEHTIEQTGIPTAATSTVQRVVTVVNEEDALTTAIQSALPAVVRIAGPVPTGGDGFFGLGAVVSKDGLVISEGLGVNLAGSYTATLADGTELALKIAGTDQANRLILWKLTPDAAHQTFANLTVPKSDAKLGQQAIALEGKLGSTVAVGRVVALEHLTPTVVSDIMTDIDPNGETVGSPLIDLSGQLIGLKVPGTDGTLPPSSYTALSLIRTLITTATAAQ